MNFAVNGHGILGDCSRQFSAFISVLRLQASLLYAVSKSYVRYIMQRGGRPRALRASKSRRHVDMPQAAGVRRSTSLTSRGLKQPISKNRSRHERLEENKQWCEKSPRIWLSEVNNYTMTQIQKFVFKRVSGKLSIRFQTKVMRIQNSAMFISWTEIALGLVSLKLKTNKQNPDTLLKTNMLSVME